MKNKEVFNLANGLNGLRKELTGRMFTHAVVLNRIEIKPHFVALEEAMKPSKEMQEYLNKFDELKKEYSCKDEHGNPIIKKGKDPISGDESFFYDIPEINNLNGEFSKKKNKLYAEYKDVIEQYEALMEDWNNKLLEKESKFQCTMIDRDDVPDEINTGEMAGIIDMIND